MPSRSRRRYSRSVRSEHSLPLSTSSFPQQSSYNLLYLALIPLFDVDDQRLQLPQFLERVPEAVLGEPQTLFYRIKFSEYACVLV